MAKATSCTTTNLTSVACSATRLQLALNRSWIDA
jgi:hypothetical protein